MIHSIDDLWLASYLVSRGAKLAGVSVLPLASGSRLRAVFELEGVSQGAIEEYSQGDPAVQVHALRSAINELRDLMYAELEKRNNNRTGIKQMPNGKNGAGQRRRGEHENRAIRNR
jgi:hypothetical protein